MIFIYIYLFIIAIVAIVATVHDKRSAVKGKWRIKEDTLCKIAFFGGGVPMYITMKIIRHKVSKSEFFIKIKIITVINIIFAIFLIYLLTKNNIMVY